MRICGIDPGLNITGYGMIDATAPGGVVLVEAGVIRTSASWPLERRLVELGRGLDDVLAEHRPGVVAVEALYSHYAHPKTAIMMGHARGVLIHSAGRAGAQVLSLPATRVKRTLSGNGQASKAQMQRAIMNTLGLGKPPEPADVADALAVALCAALRRQSERAMNRPAGATAASERSRP